MMKFRSSLLAACLWVGAISSASAQYGLPWLPPNSVIGNIAGQTAPQSAIPFDVLASQLIVAGGLVKGPASAVQGHPALFGASPNILIDGGGTAGSGTMTQMNCGAGLSGGTFNVTGTCAINLTITPQLRLTLTSGTPVMTSSVPGATTVFATPYAGNAVPIYDGTNMVPTAVSELSQATTDTTKSPAAVAGSKIYDIFVWNDSGTIRATRGPAWTNSTTRGYTLTMVSGILLNTSSIANGPAAQRGTFVGTIASNASSTIDFIFGAASSGGTAAVLNVWNAYNRVMVGTTVTDSEAAYTYMSSGIRPASGGAGMQVTFVAGASEDSWDAHANPELSVVSGSFATYGIGLDATNAYASPRCIVSQSNFSTLDATCAPFLSATSIGQHVVSLNQASDNINANTFNKNSTDSLSFRLRM